MTARARRGGTFGARLSAARLEALLAGAVTGGILLLLLTPLVLTPSTYFPYVVGKAVYARSVIEIVVGLWVVLALLAPAYRPRRSLVLVLLGAGIASAVASALMGASPQRSLWSSYERMQGVVETAHWAALALAAACTLQAPRQWRVLFNCSLAVGAAVAVIAICQGLGVTGVPFYGTYISVGGNRVGGTLGNPIYLSAYLLINAVLACGLLARSFARDPAPADAAGDGRREGRAARRAAGRRRTPTPDERKGQRRAVLWRTFWLAALAVHLWAVEMAGSLGPILGAAGGVGALALACLALARRRRTRLLGMGLVCALALVLVLALPVVLQATGTKSIARSVDSHLLRRLIRLDVDNMTVRTRLAAWQAGFAGFADRPLFGWGPENFLVVFGRHGEEFPKRMQPHDAAHSAFVEELATKGAVGAGIYLALWAAAVVVLLRAAGVARGRERMLVLTVGTALMTYLASTQSLFATTVGSMQFALLIAFVAGLEMRTRPAPGNRWRVPRGLPVPAAVVVGLPGRCRPVHEPGHPRGGRRVPEGQHGAAGGVSGPRAIRCGHRRFSPDRVRCVHRPLPGVRQAVAEGTGAGGHRPALARSARCRGPRRGTRQLAAAPGAGATVPGGSRTASAAPAGWAPACREGIATGPDEARRPERYGDAAAAAGLALLGAGRRRRVAVAARAGRPHLCRGRASGGRTDRSGPLAAGVRGCGEPGDPAGARRRNPNLPRQGVPWPGQLRPRVGARRGAG